DSPRALVPAQLVLQLIECCLPVDLHILDIRHFGEVFEVFWSEVLAVAGVVRAAGKYPGSAAGVHIRIWFPEHTGNWKFREVMLGFHGFDFVDQQPEAVAHVDYGRIDRRSTTAVEHQAHRVGFAPNPKRMNFTGRLS